MYLTLGGFGCAHGPVGGSSSERGSQWSSCLQGQTAGNTFLQLSLSTSLSFPTPSQCGLSTESNWSFHLQHMWPGGPPLPTLTLPPPPKMSCWFSAGLASLPSQPLLMQAPPPFPSIYHLLHGPVYPLLGSQIDGSLRCPGMLCRGLSPNPYPHFGYGCPIYCESKEREKRNNSCYHDFDITFYPTSFYH